nr:hypothetical protein [Tanacetum cinerariifolium]
LAEFSRKADRFESTPDYLMIPPGFPGARGAKKATGVTGLVSNLGLVHELDIHLANAREEGAGLRA